MTAIITFERWQKRLWDLVQIHKSVCEEEGVKAVAEVDTRKLRLAMHRTIKQVSLALSTFLPDSSKSGNHKFTKCNVTLKAGNTCRAQGQDYQNSHYAEKFCSRNIDCIDEFVKICLMPLCYL
jgi:carbamoylphosphate synthase small subunit